MKRVLKGLIVLAMGATMMMSAGCKSCREEPGTDSGDAGMGTDSGVCGDGRCSAGETCGTCPGDCGGPCAGGCEPLGPGDPVVPGGLGACCENANIGGTTAEGQGPL